MTQLSSRPLLTDLITEVFMACAKTSPTPWACFGRPVRLGRPGLIGTAARTAVVAGTATAVAGGVSRRRESRAAEQPQYAQS
jgi:hypothetical protein